jgi:hypothetical protein
MVRLVQRNLGTEFDLDPSSQTNQGKLSAFQYPTGTLAMGVEESDALALLVPYIHNIREMKIGAYKILKGQDSVFSGTPMQLCDECFGAACNELGVNHITQLPPSLDCSEYHIGEGDGKALGVMMQSEHCRLTSLSLGANGLGEAAGTALGAALQSEHCRLTSLDLSNNRLGDAGKANFMAFPWVQL